MPDRARHPPPAAVGSPELPSENDEAPHRPAVGRIGRGFGGTAGAVGSRTGVGRLPRRITTGRSRSRRAAALPGGRTADPAEAASAAEAPASAGALPRSGDSLHAACGSAGLARVERAPSTSAHREGRAAPWALGSAWRVPANSMAIRRGIRGGSAAAHCRSGSTFPRLNSRYPRIGLGASRVIVTLGSAASGAATPTPTCATGSTSVLRSASRGTPRGVDPAPYRGNP